jgi:hypothetical protein
MDLMHFLAEPPDFWGKKRIYCVIVPYQQQK